MWDDPKNFALLGAGIFGSVTAIAHGFVMQRRVVTPLLDAIRGDRRISRPVMRLLAPLLHASTLSWFTIGALLMWAGVRATGEPRSIICATGVVTYAYATFANLIATKGRHYGWLLMAVATFLTIFGAV